MKVITNAIAEKNIGRYIDCYRRFGIFPLKIIKCVTDGKMLLKDFCGVCRPIDDTGHNRIQYDYMFDMVSEEMELTE